MFHFLYRDFNWVDFVDWIIWRFNPPLEEIREELFAEVNIPYIMHKVSLKRNHHDNLLNVKENINSQSLHLGENLNL